MVRGVGGVCDMCLCFAWGGVGGVGRECVTGLGLGFPNSGGTWRKWDMGMCLVAVVWMVLGRVWWRLVPGSFYVCMCCESGFSVLMAGPGICILY